jgi:hypothetical protein
MDFYCRVRVKRRCRHAGSHAQRALADIGVSAGVKLREAWRLALSHIDGVMTAHPASSEASVMTRAENTIPTPTRAQAEKAASAMMNAPNARENLVTRLTVT